MPKPIGEFIVDECRKWSRCIDKHDKAYKVHQDRLNFLYKAHARCGRDHLITIAEVKRCRLDPIQP